jgi:RHS repeat-associated protein
MVTLAANSPVSGTFKWYSAASGGVPLQTSAAAQTTNNYTTPSLSTTTTYYVSFTNASNCESTRTAVIATVNANNPANAPTITNRSRCGTGAISLSATSTSSGTFRWYNALVGGALLRTSSVATTDNYTIQSLSTTTTYYVTFHNGTCESAPRRAVTATINPIVTPTVVPAARCGPGTISLTANSSSAGVFRWYTALTGGTASQVSQAGQTTTKYVIPSLSATTTYYVTFHNGVCESTPRTPIVATINPVAIAPTATATDGLCGTSGSVPLSATSGTPGVFKWYAEEAGGTAVQTSPAGQTANSFTTPEIATSTSFYVTFTNSSGCESTPRTQIVAPVMPSVKQLVESDSLREVFIPQAVMVSRSGKIATEIHESHTLSEIHENDAIPLFGVLSCTGGSYYVGFQLYYDAGGLTTTEWAAELTVSLQKGSEKLWTTPLLVTSKNQIFIATNFYNLPIICSADYSLKIEKKHTCQAPLSNISIKALFFKDQKDLFDVNSPLELNCSHSEEVTTLTIVSDVNAATEYDVEWVFIAEHEKYDPALHGSPFSFKEPVRVTVPKFPYLHRVFYQTGKIWYRARPVGYHLQYPDHRMVGNWVNGNCSPLAILNPEDQKNWQVQTVFAEEGKNKKVVQYFDGTLRSRQTQTNLSSEDVTLVGETLYDYEGRKSVEVLAAPEASYTASLKFKPGINTFTASDPLVIANVDNFRKKFHYDNRRNENSILSKENGAARYYSDQNSQPKIHSELIPNGEGFVYSQIEYLNDGTGRVSRQSGVGKEFKIDGQNARATRYFYGSPTPAELIRLFGANVGNATHYKKNLVVDANGQVSVSYHDQSDKVVATALAGNKPDNLVALPNLPNDAPIEVDITSLNQRSDGVSVTTHKILNVAPATQHKLTYNVLASNPSFGAMGCPNCKLDLTITVTDPLGQLLNLGAIPGNQSTDPFQFERKGISGLSCTPQNATIEIDLPTFMDIGDYTVTKRLQGGRLSYDELNTIVRTWPEVQTKLQELTTYYNNIDYTKCAVCTTQPTQCTDVENTIIETFNKVVTLDCENIVQQIKAELRRNRSITNPDDFDYEPTGAEITAHANYCKYQLCVQNKESDVFDKLLTRPSGWQAAFEGGLSDPISIDPFFNTPGLSGVGAPKTAMQNRLDNMVVVTINSSVSVRRKLRDLVDPDNAAYYIDDFGNATNSNQVGRHVLYMYLMGRKSQMSTADYNSELDRQRWALFRGFYLEEKRKVKLTTNYKDCVPAKTELEQNAGLPNPITEQSVRDWEKGKILTDPVSDQQLRMAFFSIKFGCSDRPAFKISDTDSTAIIGYLRTYFNSNPNNFFRVILKNDLVSTPPNASLVAINTILAKPEYGCNLDSTAQDDPIVCLDQRREFYQVSNKVVNPDFLNCSVLSASLLDPDCAWTPVSGAPRINSLTDPTGVIKNYLTLRAKVCDSNSDAIRGVLNSPLVPGKKYIFSVKSRPTDGNPNWNFRAFCEFSRSNLFNPIMQTSCGAQVRAQSSNSIGVSSSSTAPQFAWPPNNPNCATHDLFTCCTMPGVANIDPVDYGGGDLRDRIWDTGFLFREPSWHSYSLRFTATQASTNFVFSITSTQQLYSSHLSPFFNYGNFEEPTDPNVPTIFEKTNGFSYGSINFGAGNCGSSGLAIRLTDNCPNPNNPSCPCPNPSNPNCPPPCDPFDPCPNPCRSDCPPPCPDPTNPDCFCIICPIIEQPSAPIPSPAKALLNGGVAVMPNFVTSYRNIADFYSVNDGQAYDYYVVRLFVKTPTANYISNNPLSGIKLSLPPGSSGVISNVNIATLASTNDTWTLLTLNTTVFPSRVSLVTDISDNNVNASGTLLADNFSVYGVKNATWQSIDIKDVSITEDAASYDVTFCAQYQTPPATDYISQFTAQCNQDLVDQATTLRTLAEEKLLETEITTFSNTYRAQCLDGAQETFKYAYTPKEYHYTLYYYDQAGNLAQTVPPEGVMPVPIDRLGIDNPQHKLITRYQYNSLNQLLNQTTPDAGKSDFWYNDKSQLRLSQNAQQRTDNKYSYTQYDAQGRITEVGEMTTTEPITALEAQLEDPEFPRQKGIASSTYALSDITRTHYDFSNNTMQWTNVQNMTITGGNTLVLGSNTDNTINNPMQGHAFTINAIPAGQDGYLEFSVGTTITHGLVGLTGVDIISPYEVDYGLLIEGGNTFLLENCNPTTLVTAFTPNDKLRIERVGNTIYYKKNGIVVLTSSIPSSSQLFGICDLGGPGSRITNFAMDVLPSPTSYPIATNDSFAQQNIRNRVSWTEVLDKTNITVFKNDGASLASVPNNPGGGVSPSLVTLNGQSYVKVENVCHCEGATQVFGNPISVTPGERYLLRVKGYTAADNAPEFFAYFYNQDGTIALTPNRGEFHLPMGAQAENWVEQEVEVPEGVAYVQLWIAWRWPASGDFYVNQIELIKKVIDTNDRVVTQYTYDPHGNVKSLLQFIPGLPPKRTDYVYDLVSGKVDFVMYQYGEKDQFIHRYEYDPDNRITIVKTSSDGFIWDNDAEYQYYLHGPLARTMLGQHTLQGLDYYYTLQGWLKGVNSPTGASAQANDPGGDGHGTSKFAKDVMAFNLGYYQGDYKPIGASSTAALIETSSPLLWRGAGGEALDLYNGNIAWMATDLSAIASAKADRNKGVQAMQYNYDQLHRIVRSRSRTFSGVIDPRTGSPAPYDENYTYDANGNILTLLRNNELGAVSDNFTYQYYTGTNRLRGVKPITDNVTYRAAVTSNTKVYSNITVTDDAYVPDGADVTLRATENIYLHPRFKKAGGKSFRAYITDEGNYQYDAIGNLIVDNAEGTKISWTPYGKVRQVKAKGDSVTVSYRYDASGNRVQKSVSTLRSEKLIWKDAAYLEVTPTSIRSTVSGCCGGAVSEQMLPANTDGWLEFTTNDIVGTKGIGFSAVNTDNSPYSIDYSFYMSQYSLSAFEEGQFKGYYNFAAGDLFRIERTNGVINYYQNGNLLYTSLVPSTTALMVDVGTDALGTSIENIRTSFTSKPASTIITNYVRDASGNVMAIYQSPLSSGVGTGLPARQAGLRLIEQPIYGSSRLGMYTGGRKEGQRRLGQKNYELTNHLGNVLTVITDNINMSITDGVTATVVSATDYYPFGLEMKGRSFSDESYRYGFNGKEKDNSFAKDNSYDYGFRIYNPRIARFLSVDPLTKSYPWYTPYQFAGNKPIWAIDLDGLEELIFHKIKSPSLLEAIDAGFVTYPLMQTANGIGNFYRKVEAQVKGEETYDRAELVISIYENGMTELNQESTPTPARNGWQGVKETGSDALDMANVMGGNSATGIFTKIPAKGQIVKDILKGLEGVKNVFTTGIKHGTDLHWETILNSAVDLAKKGDKVFVNKTINTALGKTIDNIGGLKPDLIGVSKNGVVNIVEVISPSQTAKEILDKVATMTKELTKQGYTVTATVLDEGGKIVNK